MTVREICPSIDGLVALRVIRSDYGTLGGRAMKFSFDICACDGTGILRCLDAMPQLGFLADGKTSVQADKDRIVLNVYWKG